jgi:hypothetical protein
MTSSDSDVLVIHLARKPLSEGSVAANAQKHGVGALNIDGSRVRLDSLSAPPGRWPANLVLQHLPGCQRVGTRRVKGSTGGASPEAPNQVYGKWTRFYPSDHVDENGLETVAAWRCVSGCPVADLDAESGERPVSGAARTGRPATARDKGTIGPGGSLHGNGALHNDKGTASRFFLQVGGKPSDDST